MKTRKFETLYIASKWENRSNVAALAKRLEALGYAISHNWFEVEAAFMEDAPIHARLDMQGVADCDIFVAWPQSDHINTYVELGMALAWHKKVIIVGHMDRNCLFTRLREPAADIERFDDVESFEAWMEARE